MTGIKEKIIKAFREEQATYKGSGIRMALECSAVTLEARRQWNSTFKILTEQFPTQNSTRQTNQGEEENMQDLKNVTTH